MKLVGDICFVSGFALITYAGYLIWYPLTFIIPGVFFLYISGFPFKGGR